MRIDLLRIHAQHFTEQALKVRHCKVPQGERVRHGLAFGRHDQRGRFGRGLRWLCERLFLSDHAITLRDDHLLPQDVRRRYRKSNGREPLFRQYLGPGFRKQSGRPRDAQRSVFVQPPAFQQAERHMRHEELAAQLVEEEQTTPRQCRLDIPERCANSPRGMQHIGRHHVIVTTQANPLRGKRLLDIEDRRSQIGIRWLVLLFGVKEECLGEIRVGIFLDIGRIRREFPEQRRRRRPRTGSDLQNANAGRRVDREALCQIRQQGLCQNLVIKIGDGTSLVSVFDQFDGGLRKEYLFRRLLPSQDSRQGTETRFDESHCGFLLPLCLRLLPLFPQTGQCRPFAQNRQTSPGLCQSSLLDKCQHQIVQPVMVQRIDQRVRFRHLPLAKDTHLQEGRPDQVSQDALDLARLDEIVSLQLLTAAIEKCHFRNQRREPAIRQNGCPRRRAARSGPQETASRQFESAQGKLVSQQNCRAAAETFGDFLDESGPFWIGTGVDKPVQRTFGHLQSGDCAL